MCAKSCHVLQGGCEPVALSSRQGGYCIFAAQQPHKRMPMEGTESGEYTLATVFYAEPSKRACEVGPTHPPCKLQPRTPRPRPPCIAQVAKTQSQQHTHAGNTMRHTASDTF